MTTPPLPTVEIISETSQLWDAYLQPAGCPACGSGFLLASDPAQQRCPACWRANLEIQPARLRPEPPELVIPFPRSPQDYLSQAQKFVQPVWLRPDELQAERLIQRLVPIYLPHWLVDGNLRGDWQAQVGYDYQVQSSQERYAGNNWQVHKVVETRVRWEARLGQIERRYENLPAPAASDAAGLSKRIGVTNPQEGHPYRPDLLKNALVRIPDMPPESAWPIARARFEGAAAESCQQAAGGQHIQQFKIHAEYRDLNWTQLLQPYYATAYQDEDGRLLTILLNPFNGQFSGPRLASTRKAWTISGISALIAVVLFVFGALTLAGTAIVPPSNVLGILAIIGGIAAAIFALAPVIWAWNWNKQQDIPPANQY
jgi:hypothetical protein